MIEGDCHVVDELWTVLKWTTNCYVDCSLGSAVVCSMITDWGYIPWSANDGEHFCDDYSRLNPDAHPFVPRGRNTWNVSAPAFVPRSKKGQVWNVHAADFIPQGLLNCGVEGVSSVKKRGNDQCGGHWILLQGDLGDDVSSRVEDRVWGVSVTMSVNDKCSYAKHDQMDPGCLPGAPGEQPQYSDGSHNQNNIVKLYDFNADKIILISL